MVHFKNERKQKASNQQGNVLEAVHRTGNNTVQRIRNQRKHLIFLLCVLGLQKFHLTPKQKQAFRPLLQPSLYLLKARLERHNTIRIHLIKAVKTFVQEMELQSMGVLDVSDLLSQLDTK